MLNFLQETKDYMLWIEKQPKDIIFIGNPISGHSCSWEEFKLLADFEYNDRYGEQAVVTGLEIVFKDSSFMERFENRGSEGWKYKEPFQQPLQTKPITSLQCTGITKDYAWNTVEEVNG